MQSAAPVRDGPMCYACAAAATTRCQSCGSMSCVRHVDSIYVSHGNGGAYELRCENCYSSAVIWKVVGATLAAIVVAVVLSVMFSKGAGPFAR